eukprot:764222-Hanusia_phi.AAC.2
MTDFDHHSAIPSFERGRLSPVAKIRSDVAMTRKSLDFPRPSGDTDRFFVRQKKQEKKMFPPMRERGLSLSEAPAFPLSPELEADSKFDSTRGWAVASVKEQVPSRQARDLAIMRKWHTMETMDSGAGMEDLLGRETFNSPLTGSKKHSASPEQELQGHKKGKGGSSPLMRVRSRVFAAIQLMPAASRSKAKFVPHGALAPLEYKGAMAGAEEPMKVEVDETMHAAEDFSDSLIHNLIEEQREHFEIYRKYLNKADSL